MRGLLGFARGLSLDEATVREIYETVGREGMATGAGDDVRLAEPPLRSPRRREHPRRGSGFPERLPRLLVRDDAPR